MEDTKDYEIKMDGEFHQFEGGGIRYTKTGKGRFDLIPYEVIAEIFKYVWTNDLHVNDYKSVALASAYKGDYITSIISIVNEKYTKDSIMDKTEIIIHQSDFLIGFTKMLRELAVHYEKGADKYGADNWKKGIPAQSFRDSGLRHLCQWISGETDEPHHIAAIWNFFGAIYLETQTAVDEE